MGFGAENKGSRTQLISQYEKEGAGQGPLILGQGLFTGSSQVVLYLGAPSWPYRSADAKERLIRLIRLIPTTVDAPIDTFHGPDKTIRLDDSLSEERKVSGCERPRQLNRPNVRPSNLSVSF